MKRRRVLLCIILTMVFNACYSQNASSADSYPARFAELADLLQKGQCQQAWDEIWRRAAEKDYYAVYLIAISPAAHPFRLSGVSRADLERIFLPSVFYALLASGADLQQEFIIKMREEIAPFAIKTFASSTSRETSEAALDCLKSKAPSDVCIEKAVANKLIPSYDEYIRTALEISQHRLRVSCDTSSDETIPKSDPNK